MKNILILTSKCFSDANANGLCAQSIKKALEQQKCKTWILGFSSETSDANNSINEACICYKKSASITKKNKLTRYVDSIHRIFKPTLDNSLVNDYYKAASEIIETEDIDVVIAIYYPIETLAAIIKLKKSHLHIKSIAYELDSATDGVHPGGKGDLLFDQAYVKWMRNCYKYIDGIFVMKCHYEHFQKVYGIVTTGKTEIVDIPVLEKKQIDISTPEKITIDFFYTGLLDLGYRSPERLLSLFNLLLSNIDWRLHFYSKGNCEELIRQYADIDDRIKQHGYVPVIELERAISNADFMISIGNSNSNSLPSKLINYICSGKPIIHFSLQESDVCLQYLKSYPYAFVIHKGDPLSESAQLLKVFVSNARGKKVDYATIENLLYMNKPEFSAQRIIKVSNV